MPEKRDLWRRNSTGVLYEMLHTDALNWRSKKAFVVFRAHGQPASEVFYGQPASDVFVCRMDAFIESFTYQLSCDVFTVSPKSSLSVETDEVPS